MHNISDIRDRTSNWNVSDISSEEENEDKSENQFNTQHTENDI